MKTLHQAKDDGVGDNGGLSCVMDMERQAEDTESAYIDPDRVVVSGPKCRGCGKRLASVVVLPCRHLCLCAECNGYIEVCSS